MAFLLENGNYVKVQGIEGNQIVICRYENQESRKKEKTIGFDEFDKTIIEYITLPYEVKTTYQVDSERSFIDNEITMGYLYLKTLEKYNNSKDL